MPSDKKSTVVHCAFCANPDTITDVELRLIGYQQLAQNVLDQVEKIGRHKIKAQYPDLLKALDGFNIAGDAYAQTFFERFKLATAVCLNLLSNKQVDKSLNEYAQHCRHYKHSTF